MSEAPDTPEMKALAAFLHASFSNGMNGAAMREAIDWSIGRDLAAAPADPAANPVGRTWEECVDSLKPDGYLVMTPGTPFLDTGPEIEGGYRREPLYSRAKVMALFPPCSSPQTLQGSRLSGLRISKEWLTAKLAEGDDSNCQVGRPQQVGVAQSAKKMQTPLEIVAELLVMAKTQGRRNELKACIEKALDMTRILVAQEQTTPSRQPPAPALNEAEFLSKRLARVAELAGVPMPDMSHEGIAGVAGTILGSIARSLEGRTLHGQRMHFTPDGVQSEPATLVLPAAGPKGQP